VNENSMLMQVNFFLIDFLQINFRDLSNNNLTGLVPEFLAKMETLLFM